MPLFETITVVFTDSIVIESLLCDIFTVQFGLNIGFSFKNKKELILTIQNNLNLDSIYLSKGKGIIKLPAIFKSIS